MEENKMSDSLSNSVQVYSLRPFLYWLLLLMTGCLVLFPFYLVYYAGKVLTGGQQCLAVYGNWGVIEASHLVLWSSIFVGAVAFYPIRLERDDDRCEFKLVTLSLQVPCPFDQIQAITTCWTLPGYINVKTTLMSFVLCPAGGAQNFVDDYEAARARTNRYGKFGPAAPTPAPVTPATKSAIP
eukprot:TRINITY_DN78461_c0_g1_i1.p1 TRINITY_DN78461_c0_g1~~TRINITY_DN78461_c0_g1_i1.p1  ORF type:complete len:183 (+),score=27.29 TRINITY_DN78461_c0_g1_i1:118-666(+)